MRLRVDVVRPLVEVARSVRRVDAAVDELPDAVVRDLDDSADAVVVDVTADGVELSRAVAFAEVHRVRGVAAMSRVDSLGLDRMRWPLLRAVTCSWWSTVWWRWTSRSMSISTESLRVVAVRLVWV